MPYISRLQSTINKADACSAGNKKAGLVYSSDYSRIPTNILKSKTSTNILFSATSGNCCSGNTKNDFSYPSHINIDGTYLQEDYILDAQMSDIPDDGVLEKLLIFRNYPLDLQNMTITKKANTLGSILVVGKQNSSYGNFTDFKNVSGLESIAPPTTTVTHKMNNVNLIGLGNNTDDKDINALTLVNVSNTSTFTNIQVIDAQDDGIEIFGGNVNMYNVMVDSAADDYFDTDHAHSGTITNLKLFQTSKRLGKSLIECGNSGGTTTTTFVNVTFNGGLSISTYQNNGSDKNFNIKSGSEVTINGFLLTAAQDEFPGAV